MKALLTTLLMLNLLPNMKEFKENFKVRKTFQKTIYLLQELGIKFGYHFSWYLNGPYSSSLADDGYEMVGLRISEKSIGKFKSKTIDIPNENNINILFNNIDLKSNETSDYLELLASIHFLLTHAYPKIRNENEAKQKLKQYKPDKFSDKEIENAVNNLRAAGLIQ